MTGNEEVYGMEWTLTPNGRWVLRMDRNTHSKILVNGSGTISNRYATDKDSYLMTYQIGHVRKQETTPWWIALCKKLLMFYKNNFVQKGGDQNDKYQ